jgi:hypothetical protein
MSYRELAKQLEGVTINLSKEKSEKYFHNALCNGLGAMCNDYQMEFKYDKNRYSEAKRTLTAKIKKGKIPVNMLSSYDDTPVRVKDICFEDVLMEMLRNGDKLFIKQYGDKSKAITLNTIHKRVSKTALHHLIEYINETGGDSVTASEVLQTVFLGESIYG